MDLSSIYSGQSSIQYLVDQYMQLEGRSRDTLIEQKTKLNKKKSIFSELDSKLSALKTKLDYLTDSIVDHFAAKKSSSSDSAKVGITAETRAVNGNHTITVERLASSDRRVSNQYLDSESSFTGFTTDQTFIIEVAHPTDADANNRIQISVTVGPAVFSGSNDEVLRAISEAINDTMSQAASNKTIEGDEIVHASVVTEESGKSRLVLSSEQPGYTNRMDFGASSLLDALAVNANVQSTGAAGGYITFVGSNATDSLLSSKFVIDGLTFYRDSNSVTDAYSGLTFKLLDTFNQPETITVSTDAETVKNDVQEFIDKYNEAVRFLRKNSRMDSDTKERGVLSGDITYSGMLSELRNLVAGSVTTTSSSDYTLLYHVGIEANQEGILSIKNSDKFTTAIEANYHYVADLFSSNDGVAKRLEAFIKNYVKTNGTIDASKNQLDTQVRGLDDRIKYMNEILDKKEKYYFEQFSKLQETMYTLQNQQAFFNSFIGQ